jgi:hypothetical protein
MTCNGVKRDSANSWIAERNSGAKTIPLTSRSAAFSAFSAARWPAVLFGVPFFRPPVFGKPFGLGISIPYET